MATTKISNQRVLEVIEEVLGTSDRIEVDLNDPALAEVKAHINKSRVRFFLSTEGNITIEFPKTGTTVIFNRFESIGAKKKSPVVAPKEQSKVKPKARPKPKRHQHSYVAPHMAKDIMSALIDEASHVLWFKGPTGTGKTVLAHYICKELDRKLYQINCHAGMGDESFFGEKTIVIDEETGQNKIEFQEGIVVKAMQEGLDEDGNEVGPAGLLFIDEAGAMPSQIAIALNRMFESDDPRRTITLEHDGGRIVRSHSKFRVVLAANTAGRGATSMEEAAYTAQMDALDISLLNRVAMTFRFGYDRNVEKRIAMEKIGDDKVVRQVIKYRDAIRDQIRAGELSTPFSTRTIVQICDAYRVYTNLAKAIYYTTFEQLLPEEQAVYNETSVAHIGVDIMKGTINPDIDYM